VNLLYENLTNKIINCFYNVHNDLGFGFLEKVYERALIVELENKGIKFQEQRKIKIFYKNQNIGDYIADLIVDDEVIVEIKAVKNLSKIHEAQLVNYLKATKIKIGLLVNFGEKLEFKRKIF